MIIKQTSNPFRSTLFMVYLSIMVGALLGSAIALSSPQIVALGLITVFAAVLVMKNPVLGILSFIALTSTVLDSEANPGISIGFGTIYFTDIILFILFWLIGWTLLTHPENKFVQTPLDVPLFLFVAVAFISTVIQILKGTITVQDSLGQWRDIMGYLIFFPVTNLLRTKKQVRYLRRSIIAFACIVSIVMIIQYILGTTLPFLPGRVEVLSTEGTRFFSVTRIIPPGYSIVFAAFVTIMTVWFFDEKYSGKLILSVPLVLTGVGVLLTFKRHFWGSLLITFLIMALISNGKEIQRILLRGLSTFSIMLVTLFFMMNYTGSTGPNLLLSSADRLFSLIRADTYEDLNSSLRWRDFENKYAIPQIASHPFIGIGVGTQYRPWVWDKDWTDFDGRNFIHNGFFWLLLRTGGIGFLLMTGIMVTVIYRGFKYWRIAHRGSYVLGFTLVIIGMLLGNWVEPLISEWVWTALIATMMAMNELSIRAIHSSES